MICKEHAAVFTIPFAAVASTVSVGSVEDVELLLVEVTDVVAVETDVVAVDVTAIYDGNNTLLLLIVCYYS